MSEIFISPARNPSWKSMKCSKLCHAIHHRKQWCLKNLKVVIAFNPLVRAALAVERMALSMAPDPSIESGTSFLSFVQPRFPMTTKRCWQLLHLYNKISTSPSRIGMELQLTLDKTIGYLSFCLGEDIQNTDLCLLCKRLFSPPITNTLKGQPNNI